MTSKISVVIPCYNAETYIEQAIQSVVSDAFEVIVVDDSSTDGSAALLEGLGSQITLIRAQKIGACAARNLGLSLTTGSYTMFLDADDWLEPGALSGLARSLDVSDADFALAPVVVEDANGDRTNRSAPRIEHAERFLIDWLIGIYVPPCGILWRTETVRQLGGWNEKLLKNQDGDLVLRAIQSGAAPTRSEIAAAVYRDHDSVDRISNTVTSKKLQDSFEVIRAAHIRAASERQPSEELSKAFSIAFHGVERLAARTALSDVEQEIRAYRLASGWPPAEGGWGHVTASRIFGLAAKERMAKWIRPRLGIVRRRQKRPA